MISRQIFAVAPPHVRIEHLVPLGWDATMVNWGHGE